MLKLLLNSSMSVGKRTNRMEITFSDDGVKVEFIDLTPEEYDAQPEPPIRRAHVPLHLNLSEDANKNPNLRMMASEAAIYGVMGKPGHIWGE